MKNLFNSYHQKEHNWFMAFMISHIFGWLIAWIQTIWILVEIRKIKRRLF